MEKNELNYPPETDEEFDAAGNFELEDPTMPVVPAEFAARLERERDDLRARLRKITAALQEPQASVD